MSEEEITRIYHESLHNSEAHRHSRCTKVIGELLSVQLNSLNSPLQVSNLAPMDVIVFFLRLFNKYLAIKQSTKELNNIHRYI